MRRHSLVDDGGGNADHADLQPTALNDTGRLEDEFPRLLVEAVYRKDGVSELPRQCSQMRWSIGEVPMGGHPVQLEGVQDGDEDLPLAADNGVGPVEGIAIVERDHSTSSFLAKALQKGRHAGVATEKREDGLLSAPNQFGMWLQIAMDVVDLEKGNLS